MPIVNAIKAVASQLIVWHHLAFYGPMSDVVYPHAPGTFDWLYNQARMAVQAFLVLGGFLAANSLFTKMEAGGIELRSLFWNRYLRLARPYLVALAAALCAGVIARSLIHSPGNPSFPSWKQVVAHVFFLQDIAGEEALSAGVWYVAIDFQLYVLLVLVLWGVSKFGKRNENLAVCICGALAGVSLFWINRNPALDIWAPYFFGAYGLGVVARWISTRGRKVWWTILLAVFVAAALTVEWRARILVAGVTAVVLATTTGYAPRWSTSRVVTFLGSISYSVFLIHYPVCLVVNAVVYHLWPVSAGMNALGMLAAWLLSISAGALLYRYAEQPATATVPVAVPMGELLPVSAIPFEAFSGGQWRVADRRRRTPGTRVVLPAPAVAQQIEETAQSGSRGRRSAD